MAPSDRYEFNQRRRQLFDRDPGRYRDGRPGYPPELFAELSAQCGLRPGSRVLEIGPGTGQATGPLLNAGAEVVAVELGADLAAALAEELPNDKLTIKVGAFEDLVLEDPVLEDPVLEDPVLEDPVLEDPVLDADLEPQSFDLVVSATAFHWVAQPEGFQLCHQLLRPDGHLALWWNFFGDPDRPDPFHEAIQPLLTERAPQLLLGDRSAAGANPYALDVAARTADIDGSALFGPVTHTRFPWTGRHSPATIRAMFGSFSPWLALEPEIREPLLDDLEALAADRFDGVVERPYITALYTAAPAR